MIAIIDYGMGNIHSVKKALELSGAKTLVTNNPQEIKNCDKVVLPGVGAFDDAMQELESKGLILALKEHIKNKKLFLGICLGLQLLFERSQEAEKFNGLGILKGRVKKFENKKGFKVPHIGWNQLQKETNCPLLKDIPDSSYVYFCHSYYPEPKHLKLFAAVTEYGGTDFASVVWQDNVFGVQFHPEKSQETGLKILKNFIQC